MFTPEVRVTRYVSVGQVAEPRVPPPGFYQRSSGVTWRGVTQHAMEWGGWRMAENLRREECGLDEGTGGGEFFY